MDVLLIVRAKESNAFHFLNDVFQRGVVFWFKIEIPIRYLKIMAYYSIQRFEFRNV